VRACSMVSVTDGLRAVFVPTAMRSPSAHHSRADKYRTSVLYVQDLVVVPGE
jgi:hypothetical protein